MTEKSYVPPLHRGLDIVYGDHALVVLGKPSGLLSVPGRGAEKQDCLARRVQAEFADALIVHRLDMETSGLLVFARGKEMQRRLSILFQDRRVEKSYVAVVDGVMTTDHGDIALPLAADWPNRPRQKVDVLTGKPSLTHYRVLRYDPVEHNSRVELRPETGRTHQLRVHLQALGHPILGDALYADTTVQAKAPRLLLHADRLTFTHPESGELLTYTCPAPF